MLITTPLISLKELEKNMIIIYTVAEDDTKVWSVFAQYNKILFEEKSITPCVGLSLAIYQPPLQDLTSTNQPLSFDPIFDFLLIISLSPPVMKSAIEQTINNQRRRGQDCMQGFS